MTATGKEKSTPQELVRRVVSCPPPQGRLNQKPGHRPTEPTLNKPAMPAQAGDPREQATRKIRWREGEREIISGPRGFHVRGTTGWDCLKRWEKFPVHHHAPLTQMHSPSFP